jgi:hypothetical protein
MISVSLHHTFVTYVHGLILIFEHSLTDTLLILNLALFYALTLRQACHSMAKFMRETFLLVVSHHF